MPLYEYLCNDCGNTIEVIQRFSEEPLTTCDDCGGRIEKLISAPAIQFKGTGWYVTDYGRKNDGTSEGGSKSEAKTESKAKSDSSGDSKAAAIAKS